jgi:hypothetical protein
MLEVKEVKKMNIFLIILGWFMIFAVNLIPSKILAKINDVSTFLLALLSCLIAYLFEILLVRNNFEGYMLIELLFLLINYYYINNIQNKKRAKGIINDNKYQQLNQLKELLDNNIITEEEFIEEKKKILK